MRNLGVVIFGIGIMILLAGIISSEILNQQVLEGVTGRDTSYTLWYLLGGLALVLAGAAAILSQSKISK